MKPYISPAQCVGGEVCRIQPSVAVTFRENNELAYAFTGAAYVQLGKTPTGYEKLYIEETCGAAKCLVEVIGSYVTIPFFQGIAQFQVSLFLTSIYYCQLLQCVLQTYCFVCRNWL